MAGVTADVAAFVPDHDNHSMGDALYSHRSSSSITSIEPLPNPAFTFPALASDTASQAAGPRRPMSARASRSMHAQSGSISQRRSANALPNFSFNPSGTSSASSSLPSTPAQSPPQSPGLSLPTTPNRSLGHRRGGSEFIGGDGKGGGVPLMSSSPTKTEHPPVPSARLGPPPGRRGHAHRRSGAISCHDLQSILQPTDANSQPRGGSAPVTPLEATDKPYFAHRTRRSISETALNASILDDQFSAGDAASPPKAVPRMRVGFAERVEYIRPLSTISSETESSMSTIRGHSVNGSFSSVVSVGAASPSSVKMGRPSLQTTFEDEIGGIRPSTASGILDSISPARDRFGIALKLPERPKSAITIESPTATTPTAESPVRPRSQSKKRPFFWFDQRGSSRPQSATFFPTRSESSLVVTPPATPASPVEDRSLDAEAVDENLLAVKNEDDKKPRKARSWAHSLLPLRSKARTPTEEQPSPFEQHQVSAPSASNTEDFGMVADFDADNTVDIVTSSIPSTSPHYDSNASTDTASLPDSPFGPDTMSPIIDLDAALGPFNTPSGSRSPQGLGSFSRRTMHSGSFGSGLQGLTQQHRRTESAPELAPFELRANFGNASAMADVFEEEEEQYYDSKKPTKATSMTPILPRSTDIDRLRLQTAESAGKFQERGENWPLQAGLGISDSSDTGVVESVDASNSSASVAVEELPSDEPDLDSAAFARDDSPVEVVEDYEEPRASSLTKDSDSTVTPTLSDDESKQRPPLMKLNLPLAPPAIMTPDTLSSSPLSTPDYYRGGRPSFETPRIGTASSSITDNRTVNSYLMSEAGLEYRMSVDDVPSLTSSRSTMTSPPQQHPLARQSQYGGGMPQQDARSGSVSSIPSAGSERTRKRASIASLSRLVAGSFAERSKLSIESRPQTSSSSAASSAFAAAGEEGGRKKRNRISRLMTFWKSKEQLAG